MILQVGSPSLSFDLFVIAFVVAVVVVLVVLLVPVVVVVLTIFEGWCIRGRFTLCLCLCLVYVVFAGLMYVT